uniref:hypothetical protein n=1 Tax=Paenibacillus albidus TaxID=2041023 RepID=UPI001664AB20|nr:hypothetical protein [Paenibacillus albidus]
MLTNSLAPHEGVAIHVGPDLGAVHKEMLQRDVLFAVQELKERSEYGFEDIFHPLGAETVDCAKIRALPSRQPHERNVFLG